MTGASGEFFYRASEKVLLENGFEENLTSRTPGQGMVTGEAHWLASPA